MLGFYVTGHPLDSTGTRSPNWPRTIPTKLEGLERGAEVALCGILTGIQKRRNSEGKPWASMQLEDLQRRHRGAGVHHQLRAPDRRLVEDQAVLVHGLALPEEGAPPEDLGAGHRAAGGGQRCNFPA